jgi:hypothetical protein
LEVANGSSDREFGYRQVTEHKSASRRDGVASNAMSVGTNYVSLESLIAVIPSPI